VSLVSPLVTPDAEPSLPVHQAAFRGDPAVLMGLHLDNLFRTLISGGFYYFWGKARLQSYLYSQIEFAGSRLSFLGTGKEFFNGWIRVIGFFLAFIAVQFIIGLADSTDLQLWSLAFFYVIFTLVSPLAIVGLRRFRFSRTVWRGIRLNFRGTTVGFMKVFYPGAILTLLTMGVYYPHFAVKTRKYLVENSYIGHEPLAYDGDAKDLFWPCQKALALSVPTLGLYWIFFHARHVNYQWSRMSFRGARFKSTLTGWSLLGLFLTNALLLIVTVGLAWPIVLMRSLAYQVSHLTLEGDVNFDDIQQAALGGSATQEQLGELLGGSSMFDGSFA
jgi:uncharacterized membrane protein YjgN (DUF898 family)